MTPAAVGQQIRALEDHLGVVLFRRTSKGLELTPEGEAGLDPLREGFLRFEESVAAMQMGQSSDRYTIAAPREFYASWLAPRIAPFQASTPGVQYILAPDEASDFTEANLDLAIRFIAGPGELQGVQLAPALQVSVHEFCAGDQPQRPLFQPLSVMILSSSLSAGSGCGTSLWSLRYLTAR